MFKDGLPIEKVCKYTGLPAEKVKQLQKQLQTNKVSETAGKYKTRRKPSKKKK
jgi:hypothetical protein